MRSSDWGSALCSSDLAWPYLAAALVGGYLLGSVPFGLLLTRMAGLGDLRSIGSGNIGATNVLRTGHKSLAAATLLLDAGKGAAAVLIAKQWGPDMALVAAFGAVLGHRSEEHTSELQSLMRISYAVFCLKKKNTMK